MKKKLNLQNIRVDISRFFSENESYFKEMLAFYDWHSSKLYREIQFLSQRKQGKTQTS